MKYIAIALILVLLGYRTQSRRLHSDFTTTLRHNFFVKFTAFSKDCIYSDYVFLTVISAVS